jgi:hypothetical protein
MNLRFCYFRDTRMGMRPLATGPNLKEFAPRLELEIYTPIDRPGRRPHG